jgi:hypothetical protein
MRYFLTVWGGKIGDGVALLLTALSVGGAAGLFKLRFNTEISFLAPILFVVLRAVFKGLIEITHETIDVHLQDKIIRITGNKLSEGQAKTIAEDLQQ